MLSPSGQARKEDLKEATIASSHKLTTASFAVDLQHYTIRHLKLKARFNTTRINQTHLTLPPKRNNEEVQPLVRNRDICSVYASGS
jgi:hypothetical protein